MSNRIRMRVLRTVIDCCQETPQTAFRTVCQRSGLSDDAVFRAMDELEGFRRIATVRDANRGIHTVWPTEDGRCFFAAKSEERTVRRKAMIHDVILSLISAFFGALASEPLWNLLKALVKAVTRP